MSRRERLLFRAAIVASIVTILVVLAASYYGRLDTTEHLREGCERGSRNTVASTNVIRADANANRIVAEDPRVAAQTRAARAAQAKIEEEELPKYDEHIVADQADEVRDVRDRAIAEEHDVTCGELYPDPPILRFH